MQSLKDFKNEKIQNEELKHIAGGDVATEYLCSDGNSYGDDISGDTNGDGKVGKGDLVIKDTGEVAIWS